MIPPYIFRVELSHIGNVNKSSGVTENIHLRQGELLYVDGKLASANVGVTLSDDYGSGVFTSGYKASGNTLNPNRFFTSDKVYQLLALLYTYERCLILHLNHLYNLLNCL